MRPSNPTELEFGKMDLYAKLTASTARDLFKNGLTVKGVPMAKGGTIDLTFVAEPHPTYLSLQAVDQVEATVPCVAGDAPDVSGAPCDKELKMNFTYNIVNIMLELPDLSHKLSIATRNPPA